MTSTLTLALSSALSLASARPDTNGRSSGWFIRRAWICR